MLNVYVWPILFSFLWFGVVYVVRLIGADTVPARRQNKNLHFWNYATPKEVGGIANAPSRRVVTRRESGGPRARQGTNLRSFIFVTKPQTLGLTREIDRVKVLEINSYFGGGHAQLGIDNWKKRFGLRLIILLIILYINYFNIFILFFSNLVQRWPKNLHW